MVNEEHKLTVDDLIVEYMMYKVNNGYEPSFLTGEFISFLYYFESKYPVEDVTYENKLLFERFMERKSKDDWAGLKEFSPHMDMEKHPTYDDYIIKANYRLSAYDRSIINTYFMPKSEVTEIRNIIGAYLESGPRTPKRELDMNVKISKESLQISKYITSQIVSLIWQYYVNEHIEKHTWPSQCKDIEKYLLNTDLASIIGLKSIREDLLTFYSEISKRIAIMYQEDKNLKISSISNGYLAHSNYKLLVKDYEKIFEIAFSQYKSSLQIDMSKLSITETHELDGFYTCFDDVDIKTTTKNINDIETKKLTRKLDNALKITNGGN